MGDVKWAETDPTCSVWSGKAWRTKWRQPPRRLTAHGAPVV